MPAQRHCLHKHHELALHAVWRRDCGDRVEVGGVCVCVCVLLLLVIMKLFSLFVYVYVSVSVCLAVCLSVWQFRFEIVLSLSAYFFNYLIISFSCCRFALFFSSVLCVCVCVSVLCVCVSFVSFCQSALSFWLVCLNTAHFKPAFLPSSYLTFYVVAVGCSVFHLPTLFFFYALHR